MSFFLVILIAGCVQVTVNNSAQPTGTAIPTQTSGQNYNPLQTRNPQLPYVVAIRGDRDGSNIIFTYLGGQDAASLQSISITDNGVKVAEMDTNNGQIILPIGTKATFPAVNTAKHSDHIVCVGRFTGGATEVIFDSSI